MNQLVNLKDLIFIVLFSILIFFGALFLFSSLKTTKVEKRVSVRAIDKRINQRVNKRIQKLQTRNRIFKSKISDSGLAFDDVIEEGFSKNNAKFELNVFESKVAEQVYAAPETASDKVQALLDSEDRSKMDKEELLDQYKEQLIEKARAQGWAIKINDDLEVTSAKPL
jgi:hypothetical protein